MGQNEHSATLVCANYKLNDLAYYFDRAAFADYKNTFKRLEKKQIFAITDTTDINNIKNISHYNRLNLVLSHNLITDPNRSIEEYFINNSYKKCEEFGGDENIKILTYKPNRIECEKLIEVSSTNMDLHCFTWKRTQFHDTETQSDIIEYKLVVEIPRKCNTNGPDHILNEVKIPGYYINNENPFSPTFKKKLNNELKIHYSGSFSGKSSNNAMFILTIASGNKIQHIDTHYLKGLIKPDEINEIAFSSLVPNNLPEDSELRIFLWNPGSEIVIMSNLSIQLWDSFQ